MSLPLVGAPMAGGASTPAMVSEVGRCGGLGFLAGGYKTPDQLAQQIASAREAGVPFGVNLFVPNLVSVDEDALRRYADALRPEAERLQVDLPISTATDSDHWEDKLDLLLAQPVPAVSLTFGVPPSSQINALQRVGSQVGVTVTSVTEAQAAVEAGADFLVVQGIEAGGHSGAHDPVHAPASSRTAELLRAVRGATDSPLIAAGGIDGPGGVVELVRAGASAVAVGTLLLRAEESGASTTHKDAIGDSRFAATVMTRAFTGRPARGLRNRFIDSYDALAPFGYPAIHHLTRAIRAAAADRGDTDCLHLWAGTGFRHSTSDPTQVIVERLAAGL